MDQWVCTACGYIYDPEAGDATKGIPPGTAFENLPDDWFCPNCGVGKEFFEKHTASYTPNGHNLRFP